MRCGEGGDGCRRSAGLDCGTVCRTICSFGGGRTSRGMPDSKRYFYLCQRRFETNDVALFLKKQKTYLLV